MTNTMTFSEQLKAARIVAKLTQAAAANVIGCPLRTYEDWERGKRTPPIYVQRGALAILKQNSEE